MQNKKGQVTIFVIIGAVILLAAALFFILHDNLTNVQIDVPDVSLEARPAYDLVVDCLNAVSERGIREIGEQGGTLNPPTVSYPPYRSEAIDFKPTIVPYWRYLDNCDNPSGCERVFQPPLCKPSESCLGMSKGDNSIQEQLEYYVLNNIDSCINGFKSISAQYSIEQVGKPSVRFQFVEGSTNVLLHYPIEITSASTGNIQEQDDFIATQDVDMIGMYRLANELLSFERDTNYFERETMNLITAYSGMGDNELPPTNEIKFFIDSPKMWVQQDVKDIIRYDLLPFMGLIRFVNTKNFVPLLEFNDLGNYTMYSQGIYSGMEPKTSDTIYPFEVYTHYLYQPIFMQINDGKQIIKGTKLQPKNDEGSFLSKFAAFMLTDYRFRYQLSYPLVVEVKDKDAFHGDGFSFSFGLEVNIRNNIPAYNNFTIINFKAPFQKGLGDFEQRLPQNITIYTQDRYTQEPLDNVIISYVCGREYDIGLTKMDSTGRASLVTTLPYCEYGGYIKYKKPGYLGEAEAFNNREGDDASTHTFKLWPTVKKEIIIKKRTLDDIDKIYQAGTNGVFYFESAAENLSAYQSVLFNMKRIAQSPYDNPLPLVGFLRYTPENFSSRGTDYATTRQLILDQYESGFYNETTKNELIADINAREKTGETAYSRPKEFTLELSPGKYTIDATLLDEKGITIPAEVWSLNNDSGLLEKLATSGSSEIQLPERNFSTWVLGGASLNFTFAPVDIYNNRPITFYVLEMKRPTSWVDLMDMQTLEDFLKNKDRYMIPTR